MNKLCECALPSIMGAVLITIFTLLLGGCGTMDYVPDISTSSTPKKSDTASPGDYQPQLGSAASLYNQAEGEIKAGNYSKAEQLLERALRIEPKNGYYWHMLGKVKYLQQQYPQVIQFCLKSKSIAGSNAGLIQMNDQLIAKAKSQMP